MSGPGSGTNTAPLTMRKRELDLLEEGMGHRLADPLEMFRLLVNLGIPFRITYHPCFGVERDCLKEDIEYNWHCFRFTRVARRLQRDDRKQKALEEKEEHLS